MRHRKQAQILIGAILIMAASSCDPTFWARINNKSGSDIVFSIQFDKSAFSAGGHGRSLSQYLQGKLKGGGNVLSFDTINFVSDILLKKDESFIIEGGIGYRPEFFGVKKISIFKSDTLIFDNKESMVNAFKMTGKRLFNLDIK